jgi:hypothetical protein
MEDSTTDSLRQKSWRLNTPDVASELVGSEVIAIHLPTGLYFSIENVAATVWTGIERGLDFGQLVQLMTSTYDVSPEKAEADAGVLLKEMLAEKLIVEAPGSGLPAGAVSGERLPYAAPKIEKFPDLQDLLMVDPIHEVDLRGWPHPGPE